MPRKPRDFRPRALYHIGNRGIARRPVFENAADARLFLACVARSVRRGEIVVHAFCLLVTHFHLLASEGEGVADLSEAMRRITNEFVRRFNRLRRRDGSLFRGRFYASPVRDSHYLRNVVRYIDRNPPKARIRAAPGRYRFASTRHYLGTRSPPWLHTDRLKADACRRTEATEFAPEVYRAAFGPPMTEEEAWVVERWTREGSWPDEPLDPLLEATPAGVRSWMDRKARLADGSRAGVPLVAAAAIDGAVEEAARFDPDREVSPGRQRMGVWKIVRVALLREVAGLTFSEIAARAGQSPSGTHGQYRMHRSLLGEDESYATLVSGIAHRAIRAFYRGSNARVPNVGV